MTIENLLSAINNLLIRRDKDLLPVILFKMRNIHRGNSLLETVSLE
jgi:hypothetical protein